MMKSSRSACLAAFLVLLLQMSFVLLLSPGDTPNRYLTLNNWDSFHYIRIADTGYKIPDRALTRDDIHDGAANLMFFPGYPLAVRGLHWTTGLAVPVCTVLIAQFFCWIFWVYLILLMREFKIHDDSILGGIVIIALHPAAFYLVVGYTESLFLASMLGFIYWTERKRSTPSESMLVALHGITMSLTKIVALPVCAYPVIQTLFMERRLSRRALFLGAVSVLGTVSFFVFAQIQFHEWNLYFRLEEIGWGNYRRWFALLDPWTYIPRFFFEHTVDSFNRAAVPFTVALFAWAYALERRARVRLETNTWRSRVGLYFVGFLLFYIPLTGKANANMDSMIRYTFPTFVLLVLSLLQSTNRSQVLDLFTSRLFKVLFIFGSVISVIIQAWFIYRFTRGRWVA